MTRAPADEPESGNAQLDRVREITAAWHLTVRDVDRPERGTNNFVWYVNETHVLRVSRNRDSVQVAAENRLLEALAAVGLNFQIPTPIPTRDGRTHVPTTDGPATLYRRLPGRTARHDLSELELIGGALGELVIALAEVPAHLAPTDWRVPLGAIHPAVPDVAELVAELDRAIPGAPGLDVLEAHWRAVDAAYLAMDLPSQVCHLDFAPSNVLIHEGKVSAVLDFEIAGWDLRVSDLVGGLVQSARNSVGERAFLSAFRSKLELRDEEWAAVPALRLLRQISTVVWRAGRWREGKATSDEVRSRLTALAPT